MARGQAVSMDDSTARLLEHEMAIAAKCWQCQGVEYDPKLRVLIGNCTVGPPREVEGKWVGCPLHALRPYQSLAVQVGSEVEAQDGPEVRR